MNIITSPFKMGIKNLRKALRRFASKCETRVSLSDYSGKTLAVDAHIFAWKAKAVKACVPEFFGSMISEFSAANVHALFVWDGVPTPLKREELANRRKRQTMLMERYQAKVQELETRASECTGNLGEIAAIRRKIRELKPVENIRPTSQDKQMARELVESLGMENVDAQSDGEQSCSTLVRHGFADAVLSEDMDALAYGAPVLVTGYSPRKACEMFAYNHSVALEEMKMSREQFTEYCVLLGSDLCSGGATIKGLGMVRGFRELRKCGSIASILRQGRYLPNPGFVPAYRDAVRAFMADDPFVITTTASSVYGADFKAEEEEPSVIHERPSKRLRYTTSLLDPVSTTFATPELLDSSSPISAASWFTNGLICQSQPVPDPPVTESSSSEVPPGPVQAGVLEGPEATATSA